MEQTVTKRTRESGRLRKLQKATEYGVGTSEVCEPVSVKKMKKTVDNDGRKFLFVADLKNSSVLLIDHQKNEKNRDDFGRYLMLKNHTKAETVIGSELEVGARQLAKWVSGSGLAVSTAGT
ncbi:hypothetical protein Tco_0986660 [Tanacetum coccineum]